MRTAWAGLCASCLVELPVEEALVACWITGEYVVKECYDMICDEQGASDGRATFETPSNPLPGFILVTREGARWKDRWTCFSVDGR